MVSDKSKIKRRIAAQAVFRWSGRLATPAVIGAGCWVLAELFWGFTVALPAPLAMAAENPLSVATKIAARPLFGTAPSAQVVVATLPPNLKLLGVLSSATTGEARAIIRREGEDKTMVLAIGDEVSSGVRLTRIEAEQITLSSMGRSSLLALPKPAPSATPAKADQD